MRKIYLVPNFLTTANLFFGFYSIVVLMQNRYRIAAWSIMIAGIFDLLDGRVARLTRATSRFGVEYDSLSDLLSFGVAPALLLIHWGSVHGLHGEFTPIGIFFGFLFVASGAFRLARFNVNCQPHQGEKDFVGLPITLAGQGIPTWVLFCDAYLLKDETQFVVTWIFAFLLASLMVSTVKFPSYKKWNPAYGKIQGFLLVVFGGFFVFNIPLSREMVPFLILISYIITTLLTNSFLKVKRHVS